MPEEAREVVRGEGERGPQAGVASLGNVEGRLEAGVDGDLIAGDELVSFVGHADDLLEFLKHFRGHAFAEGRGGVGVNAILAVVGDTDSDVEEFLGEGIEGAGSHDGLEVFPGALKERGIVGDGLPEIVDVIGFARGHYVVVNGSDGGVGVLVFDEAEGGHGGAPWRKWVLA